MTVNKNNDDYDAQPRLDDVEREALLKKIQAAYEDLPDGWTKTSTDRTDSTNTPPFVHVDGRTSWKNPNRHIIQSILKQAAEKYTHDFEQQSSTTTKSHQNQRGALKRLRMMIKSGVPMAAVQQRAQLEGIDPDVLLMMIHQDEEESTTTTTTFVLKSSSTTTCSSKMSPSRRKFHHMKDPMKKYRRMIQVGIPLATVKQTAKMDGVDPALLDNVCGVGMVMPSPAVQNNDEESSDKKKCCQDFFVATGDNNNQVEFVEGDLAKLVTKMVQTVASRGGGKKNNTGGGGGGNGSSSSSSKQLTVDTMVLYDALGAFCGVQHSRDLYNSTIMGQQYSDSNNIEARSKRKPFLELLSNLGIRPPTDWNEMTDIAGLNDLVHFVKDKYKDELDTVASNLQAGMYDFDSLAQVYRPGSQALAKNAFAGGVDMICEVAWNRYEQGRTLFGVAKTFKVCFQFVVAVGKHFTICDFVEVMTSFEGSRDAKNLSFIPLQAYPDKEVEGMTARFLERGKVYAKIATEACYMAYDKGTFYAKLMAGKNNMAAHHTNGRVMVDTQGGYEAGFTLGTGYDPMVMGIKYKYKEYMLHMRSVKEHDAKGSDGDGSSMILFDSVPQEYLVMTWPAVIGFSFTSKAWGDILVDGIYPIHFQSDIFDNLALPTAKKRIVKALAKHSTEAFHDVVNGKGEGSIFLLYGPPGVGKTLTAEAISEMLHKPLYTVSIGQLGTSPSELETKLTDILNLCGKWDALVLFDEADIFLEKRSSTGSVERNAFVSVMLRVVEYFKGVLFLTSNRVDALDPAFKTRITLALRYEQLDTAARAQVWTNLLSASGFRTMVDNGSIDTNELAKHVLNGREIKNAIRLGMALAEEDCKPLSQDFLLETVDILNEFNNQMSQAEAF